MSNEDIRKVNNGGQSENSSAPSSDEVFGSAYDLTSIYSGEESPREREMRLRDEQRRREEMEAIREDVERRYSLQVEEAMSNMDSIVGRSAAVSGGDEEEVIDLQAFRSSDASGRKKSRKSKKAKKHRAGKKKIPVYIDLDEKNAVYGGIYSLGDTVIRAVEAVLATIIHFISIPVRRVARVFRSVTAGTKKQLNSGAKSTAREVVYLHKEIRSARKSIFASLKRPLSIPPILWHYIRKAVTRHRSLLRTAANTALPVISLLILFAVFNYWNSVTFALNVIYNNQSVGYITDESVFIKARELVMDKLSVNSLTEVTQVSAASLNAGYELALVSPVELSDARTISDRMIENSVDNLTNACGIYINGNFLCAVKNEADAKTVFYNILEPYENDASAGGYVVGFAEDIDYMQGLYRDDPDVMWDAQKLETTVLGKKGATAAYIVPETQTLDEIAEICESNITELIELNPGINQESVFEEGDTVTVPTSNRIVNIKKTVKSSRIAPIPFETITTRDATKYSGYRLVRQEGVNGTQRIVTTKTYINDALVDTSVHNEVVTPATDERIVIGTMTTYGGIYIGMASDQGFLWPAPSCHYISSPYGWRSTGWHSGVDLCTGNGTAMGSPAIAARSGTVEIVSHSGSGYGNMILINHGDGYKTRYAHLMNNSITVRPGDYVEGGKVIGKVGSTGNSTGPHLHFEVIYNGETQNPVDYIS